MRLPAASVVRVALREVVLTFAFSAVVAFALTALGSVVTTLIMRRADGAWEVLSLRSHLTIAIPTFVLAWMFRLSAPLVMRTRRRAALTAGALAVVGAIVHRIALWSDVHDLTQTVHECVDDVCFSVVRPRMDVVADAFASIPFELGYAYSLLWTSVAATALVVVAAAALQPRLRM